MSFLIIVNMLLAITALLIVIEGIISIRRQDIKKQVDKLAIEVKRNNAGFASNMRPEAQKLADLKKQWNTVSGAYYRIKLHFKQKKLSK